MSVVSIVELVWVLSDRYSSTKSELAEALAALLRTEEIRVAQSTTVWKALRKRWRGRRGSEVEPFGREKLLPVGLEWHAVALFDAPLRLQRFVGERLITQRQIVTVRQPQQRLARD